MFIADPLVPAHTAALLPAGDYKLVVKSRAGDAEGPLQSAFRRVKYLEVEDPYIAKSPDGLSKVRTLNGANDLDELEPVSSGGGFTMTGEGLARYVDAAPFLVWGEGDDEKVEISGIAAGSGSILGVGLGVMLFHVLWYALRILGVDTNLQLVLIGAILVLAVLLDIQRKRMEARRIAR